LIVVAAALALALVWALDGAEVATVVYSTRAKSMVEGHRPAR